ncbi:SIMPL domain-containing protein [Fodinibius halophilus]|uniref:SIMPL domain-containing protein n=1 Tax=Fodinibius halophilus TaxID=1736908 RepID=A0A6M1SWA4_9BACT|nr:SIMPL domain-containing protein [Fodinibius halophilus]NGP88158.1 SIMPL domain-containing protein [Fodinibius halophilus]
MRVLAILLSLLVFTGAVQAQDQDHISINASAQVLLPADMISFRINVNAEADTPQEAYKLHKKRENVLVELLKKHNIKDEEINFEPISINSRHDRSYQNEEKKRIETQQAVILSLESFDIYEEIQVTLIENNFDEFSGNFSSSEKKKGEDKALEKALKIARQKADMIAEETGLTITGIKNINYSYNQRPPRPVNMMERSSMPSTGSLLQFDQTVSVSASVSITYNFEK